MVQGTGGITRSKWIDRAYTVGVWCVTAVNLLCLSFPDSAASLLGRFVSGSLLIIAAQFIVKFISTFMNEIHFISFSGRKLRLGCANFRWIGIMRITKLFCGLSHISDF